MKRHWVAEDRGYKTACWIWSSLSKNGYGVARVPGTGHQTTAHRLAYIEVHGAVSDDLVIDHLCRVRSCVNPDHLEAVTQRENVLRGTGLAAENASKAKCPQGHPYDDANTYVKPCGRRVCRTCKNERQRASRELAKAAA